MKRVVLGEPISTLSAKLDVLVNIDPVAALDGPLEGRGRDSWRRSPWHASLVAPSSDPIRIGCSSRSQREPACCAPPASFLTIHCTGGRFLSLSEHTLSHTATVARARTPRFPKMRGMTPKTWFYSVPRATPKPTGRRGHTQRRAFDALSGTAVMPLRELEGVQYLPTELERDKQPSKFLIGTTCYSSSMDPIPRLEGR